MTEPKAREAALTATLRLRCMRCGDWHEPPHPTVERVACPELCQRCWVRGLRAARACRRSFIWGHILFLQRYRKAAPRHPTWLALYGGQP